MDQVRHHDPAALWAPVRQMTLEQARKRSQLVRALRLLFVALAADDPLFAHGKFGLIESWHAAKKPVEFHFYEQGGHGFGMYPKATTSSGWFQAFRNWLSMHGML